MAEGRRSRDNGINASTRPRRKIPNCVAATDSADSSVAEVLQEGRNTRNSQARTVSTRPRNKASRRAAALRNRKNPGNLPATAAPSRLPDKNLQAGTATQGENSHTAATGAANSDVAAALQDGRNSRNSQAGTANAPFMSLSTSKILLAAVFGEPKMEKITEQSEEFFEEMVITAWGKAVGNPSIAETLKEAFSKLKCMRKMYEDKQKENDYLSGRIQFVREMVDNVRNSGIKEELKKFKEQYERIVEKDELPEEEKDDELRELESQCERLKKELQSVRAENAVLSNTMNDRVAAEINKWEEEIENEIQKIRLSDFCAVCGEPSKIDCCFKNTYCSESCQQLHYSSHKHSCTKAYCVQELCHEISVVDPSALPQHFVLASPNASSVFNPLTLHQPSTSSANLVVNPSTLHQPSTSFANLVINPLTLHQPSTSSANLVGNPSTLHQPSTSL